MFRISTSSRKELVLNLNQSEFLEAVFRHYELDLPYGEKSIFCPVHDDSHKSASVNSDKGVWVCYACHSGGTGIHIIMARENMAYPDAMKWAEKNLGKISKTPQRPTKRRSGSRWVPPRLRRVS